MGKLPNTERSKEFTKEIQVLKHIPDTFTIPSFDEVYERIKDRLPKR